MIGIFGGTFNPIHYGHLRAALEITQALNLAHTRMMPSANPPHRTLHSMVSATHRATMVQLAVQSEALLQCDLRELDRARQMPSTPSYTLDTLISLQADFTQQTLVLCIGVDAFNQLSTWYRWQQLFDYAHIVVMTRPAYHAQALSPFLHDKLTNNPRALADNPVGRLFFQPVTPLAISATRIRHLLARQQNPRYLLPDSVLAYIKQHHLYQS
jgi:nicotinate-nucleotide adenylyltransferase